MKSQIYANQDTFRSIIYTQSHSTLVLRRPMSYEPHLAKNIDITFYGVFYIEIVSNFFGIEIKMPNEEDVAYINSRCSHPYGDLSKFVYVLHSADKKYYVAASQLEISDNELTGNNINV